MGGGLRQGVQHARRADVVKEVIAKKIIELVRNGDSNPDHLCMMTLKSLGFDLGAN